MLIDSLQDGSADAAEEFAGFCVGEVRVVQMGADVREAGLRVREGDSESGVLGTVGEVFSGRCMRAPAR